MELPELGFGFAREPDDEGASNGDAGNRVADPRQQALVALPVSGTAHVPQDPPARVLQRNIHVAADFGDLRHRRQHCIIEGRRVGIEEPHPGDALDRGQIAQQARKAVPDAEILAVGRRVLRHQHEFPGPRPGQRGRLGEHRIRIPAAEMPADLRDHAEGTGIVASLRHLDVGDVRRSGADAGGGVVVEPGDRLVGSERRGAAPGGGQHIRDALDLVEPDDRIDFGNLTGEFTRVPLRQASGDHEPAAAAFALQAGQVQNRVDPLFLGWPDEPAGVHDQCVGVRRIAGHLETATREDPGHDFAVEQVLRASEAHEPDSGSPDGLHGDRR